MIIRVAIGGFALAGAASLPLSGVAIGQVDRDCRDFGSQSEAQSSLRPGDPERLDANKNGIACENSPPSGSEPQGGPETPPNIGEQTLPSGSTTSEGSDNATPPAGGVETGYGGAAQQDEAALVATLAGAATALAAGGAAVLRYRNTHRY